MSLNPWMDRRTPEETRHFNPAYCGVLACEFIHAYENAKKTPVSFALVFCALPISLHPATRERLPRSIVTGLLPWLENNPDARIGFGDRARNLTPYVRSGLLYASVRQAILLETGALLTAGPKRVSFTKGLLEETTPDVRDTVNATRKVARWFAAAGGTPTILAAWGVCI